MLARLAPELTVARWLNTSEPLSLETLRGRVVLIEAFQMLCPGCVSQGLLQAKRVAETFSRDDVVVLGLHSVFEHHDAQGPPEALEAFLHEYRIAFHVGIDRPSEGGGVPKTMAAYELQGTPTLILIDRRGRLRKQKFGSNRTSCLARRSWRYCRRTAADSRCPIAVTKGSGHEK